MMMPPLEDTARTGRYWWYVAGLSCAGIVLVASTVLAQRAQPASGEVSVFLAINGWPELLRVVMGVCSLLGTLWVAAGAVVGAFLLKFYRLAWRLSLSILLAYGLGTAIKHLLGRPRPGELVPDAIVRAHAPFAGYLSLHAASITVVCLTLLPYLPRTWRWLVLLPIPVVALSRLYLGAHLPLDVVGGVCLGVVIVAGMRVLPHGLRLLLRIS